MTRPTTLPVNAEGIPEVLKNERRWFPYKRVWNPSRGKFDKIPVVKWGDSPNWRVFADVQGLAGFVAGGGFCTYDADRCVVNGALLMDIAAHIASLDTYTELSMSGT